MAQDLDEAYEVGGVIERVLVSTVFLGLDHRFPYDEGPPILWETMVFGGPLDQEMERYRSLADALKGHQDMCAKVGAAMPKPFTPEPRDE